MEAIEIVNCVVKLFDSPTFTFIDDDGGNAVVEFISGLGDGRTFSIGNADNGDSVIVHELLGEDDYCFSDYSEAVEEQINQYLKAGQCS